jgi:hypothetical protein
MLQIIMKVADNKTKTFSARYPFKNEVRLQAAMERNGFKEKREMLNAFIEGRLVMKGEYEYSKKENSLSDSEAILRSNKEILEGIKAIKEKHRLNENGIQKLIPPLIFFTTEDDYKLFTEELNDTVNNLFRYKTMKPDVLRRTIQGKKDYDYNFIIISTKASYGSAAKILKEENANGAVIYPLGYATFRDFLAARGPEAIKKYVQSKLIEIKSLGNIPCL